MAFKHVWFLLLGAPLLVRCQPSEKANTPFTLGTSLGTNKNKHLEEASGLVASVRNPGYLWSHNDSGHPPIIFMMDETNATTSRAFQLAHATNRDWEDITLGPGPEEGIPYLYVGDIGDNFDRYPVKYIYRLKEPSLSDADVIAEVDRLVVRLPEGAADSETLMCDPVSRNLYLVTKRNKRAKVYEVAYPFTGDTLVGKVVCTLLHKSINGGSISRDGKEVLLRNYDKILYWKKQGSETIPELLNTPPIELDYEREPQGETVAWSLDGSGFFTLSENAKGARGKLLFYRRK